MRWFKHMTNMRRDERIARLIDAHGIEGYGFYVILLEVVAEGFKAGTDPKQVYDLKRWAKFTEVSTRKFQSFTRSLAEVSLILIQTDDKLITITIPKLLEIKDEYSRKSVHTPDNVAPEGEGEGEGEVDKNEVLRTSCLEPEKPDSTPNGKSDLEPAEGVALPKPLVHGEYPCVGGQMYRLPMKKYLEWDKTFGETLNVGAELMKARQWLRDGSKQRLKTPQGMTRFLGAWLIKATNGGTGAPPLTTHERKALSGRMQHAAAADADLARREREARSRSPSTTTPESIGDLLNTTKGEG